MAQQTGALSEEEATEDLASHEAPPQIVCARCRHHVARKSDAVSFDGGHRHRFLNPAGISFDIALYAAAPGVSPMGAASDYFSWFTGYEWRIARCGGCMEHLGWMFYCDGAPGPAEPPAFAGLILERLSGA